jgi:hypothetical protein
LDDYFGIFKVRENGILYPRPDWCPLFMICIKESEE